MSESKTHIEPIDALVERDLSGWAKFIWNCTDGSNYFRYGEYCDLIRTLDRYASDLAAALAERDALAARVAELEKDAGRYRWLREDGYNHADSGFPFVCLSRTNDWGNFHDGIIEGIDLDAAIDDALAREEKCNCAPFDNVGGKHYTSCPMSREEKS